MSSIKTISKKPFYNLSKTWDPVNFQGTGKKTKYFEGWYFKNVSADEENIWSVIPGISIVNSNNRHAFIQFINGKTAESWYVKFSVEDFSYSQNDFHVQIGENHFSLDGFSLDIDDKTSGLKVSGKVGFKNLYQLNSSLLNPGIMGWYSFVPFMECNHGLVSMNHDLSGNLFINGENFNFSGGKGYSEKDWGRSMPSSWIWMQSNHFKTNQISFMLSVAKIPWHGNSFTGFLCVLLFEGKIHTFATYTGAKIIKINLESDLIRIEVADKHHILNITARHAARGLLTAPVDGAMDRRISESVDANIELTVTDSSGKHIFSDIGKTAGLELVGDMKELPLK